MHKQLSKRYEIVTKQLTEIDAQLNSLPPGFLFISHSKQYFNWYHSDKHIQTYIPKKKREFAQKLAYKKFLSIRRSNLLQEKKAIEAYFKYYPTENAGIDALFDEQSGYKELLIPNFHPISQDLAAWSSATFATNPLHPEHLIHKSLSGNLVRSKSEAIIDALLFQHHIPYRYECQLALSDCFVYPDFTIRHPQTGEFFYWEHFGRMDDPVYCDKAISKLRRYCHHQILPSVNLITTYETRERPITMDAIEQLIQHYFIES